MIRNLLVEKEIKIKILKKIVKVFFLFQKMKIINNNDIKKSVGEKYNKKDIDDGKGNNYNNKEDKKI